MLFKSEWVIRKYMPKELSEDIVAYSPLTYSITVKMLNNIPNY